MSELTHLFYKVKRGNMMKKRIFGILFCTFLLAFFPMVKGGNTYTGEVNNPIKEIHFIIGIITDLVIDEDEGFIFVGFGCINVVAISWSKDYGFYKEHIKSSGDTGLGWIYPMEYLKMHGILKENFVCILCIFQELPCTISWSFK